MQRIGLALLLVLAVGPGLAAPVPYRLDTAQSVVGFGYSMAGQSAHGTMPVTEADIVLDLEAPQNSRVSATLDAAHAETGLFLVTQAMKGPGVLDTTRYPTITFRSTGVVPAGDGARITGDLTIRDVTRPVTLVARIYRQKGTDPGDRNRLSIHLEGRVGRAAFGAGAFPDLVSDTITLDILTRVDLDR